jgi:hypothetical protein
VEQGNGPLRLSLLRRTVPLLCDKLDRRQCAETRMRPAEVVIVAPTRDDRPGFGQTLESMLVQAFVPESTVEAFNEGVLHRLPGSI